MNRNKKKKKECFTKKKKKKDNIHFIPNNILTIFFKELTKYINDYQQYLNYIYKLYYASYCISLSVFMHMHEVISQFQLIYQAIHLLYQVNIWAYEICGI